MAESITVRGVGDTYDQAKISAAEKVRNILGVGHEDRVYLHEDESWMAWRLTSSEARLSPEPNSKVLADCTFVFRYGER
jgi:hypothetical protein